MVAIQAKEELYHDWRPLDVCFTLAIEIFGYLHQWAYNFFHQCVNMVWLAKGTNGPTVIFLHVFYR